MNERNALDWWETSLMKILYSEIASKRVYSLIVFQEIGLMDPCMETSLMKTSAWVRDQHHVQDFCCDLKACLFQFCGSYSEFFSLHDIIPPSPCSHNRTTTGSLIWINRLTTNFKFLISKAWIKNKISHEKRNFLPNSVINERQSVWVKHFHFYKDFPPY